MLNGLEKFYRIVGKVNTWVGNVVLWFAIPMTILVFLEVIMRYVFNHPTIWSWDINVQLLAAMSALGGGYTLLVKGHVAVDILVMKMGKRKRATLDTVTDILTVLTLAIFTWYLTIWAVSSTMMLEKGLTVFRPPVWPLHIAVAIGSWLIMLQAICNMMQNITTSLGLARPSEKAGQSN